MGVVASTRYRARRTPVLVRVSRTVEQSGMGPELRAGPGRARPSSAVIFSSVDVVVAGRLVGVLPRISSAVDAQAARHPCRARPVRRRSSAVRRSTLLRRSQQARRRRTGPSATRRRGTARPGQQVSSGSLLSMTTGRQRNGELIDWMTLPRELG